MELIPGNTFGKWTVISSERKHCKQGWMYFCRCECGTEKWVHGSSMWRGRTTSCGCNTRLYWNTLRKHGMSKTFIYHRWTNMHKRCYYPKHHQYKNYGARGIFVDEPWHKFENFFADMGYPPTRKHSIDRINNDGPYSKENCRYATEKEQKSHTRRSKYLTWKGETLSVPEWSKRVGISIQRINQRTWKGWSAERALTEPTDHYRDPNRPRRRPKPLNPGIKK